ncbi:ABC transporter ATP-binding protein [Tenuibacillus multivorans]|uniref:Peptide/nickel transport system ATP-binding protein n=1 Tax=Tenuibacillus multivorans TaxID=237069 RepID=A0A1G9W4Q6_9BACI|nr:oligopeptide/dipeptide ABC transporter ATP-binding protein [Tenuibacillus multivorans]GEL78758.1 putative oligopeptide transport ATP-binding protein YkfD [Tenuibacillus multivorans]SDM79283.1 peptide/nickel transport system ATP-binding protein [Tenuibacillus multivorans]
MGNELLKVKNLKKYFKISKKQTLKAVDDISFNIRKGETFGVVGESGCGKSTAGRTILTLYDKTDGQVLYDDIDVHSIPEQERFKLFRNMQMIFQDPYASLNPRSTVKEIISEPMEIHGLYKGEKERLHRVYQLLEEVGLNKEHATRYPHEFSGGQRQRIGIARALALEPEFIICDEPISALDVSVQAQIINLLSKLQKEKDLTYLFIAHDLSMVRHISDRIAVMYLGHIVELTNSKTLYDEPLHPYTNALLSAVPIPDPKIEKTRTRVLLEGDLPSPLDPPSGCVFRTRCPLAQDICAHQKPKLVEVEEGRHVACHLYDPDIYEMDANDVTTLSP